MTNARALNINVLEMVTGGTVTEYEELLRACAASNPTLADAGAACAHIPGANLVTAHVFESWLSNELKISANIDLGVGGTGMFSKGNTYVDMKTGMGLSHSEVLSRIMAL